MLKDEAQLVESGGQGREIDRRTIAKGVAWTVPVVIVATAAPAAAASGVTESLSAVKGTGSYTFTLTVVNARNSLVSVQLLTLTPALNTTPAMGFSRDVAAGSTGSITFTSPVSDTKKGVYTLEYKVANDTLTKKLQVTL